MLKFALFYVLIWIYCVSTKFMEIESMLKFQINPMDTSRDILGNITQIRTNQQYLLPNVNLVDFSEFFDFEQRKSYLSYKETYRSGSKRVFHALDNDNNNNNDNIISRENEKEIIGLTQNNQINMAKKQEYQQQQQITVNKQLFDDINNEIEQLTKSSELNHDELYMLFVKQFYNNMNKMHAYYTCSEQYNVLIEIINSYLAECQYENEVKKDKRCKHIKTEEGLNSNDLQMTFREYINDGIKSKKVHFPVADTTYWVNNELLQRILLNAELRGRFSMGQQANKE